MRIAAAEAIRLAIPSRYGGPRPKGPAQWPRVEMLLVRVTNDEGMVGWGEAFGHLACATTQAAFETLVAPLCTGAEADDIAGLGERLRRSLHAYGGGPVAYALSGLDIALWDLRGKAAGMSVARLIGGEGSAPSVPAYASLLRYGDAETVAAAAADAVRRGHGAVKLHEADPATVAAARAAVGAGVGLMLDVNCRWEAEEALAMARAVAQFDLAFIEEPAWPPDPAAMAAITRETGVAVAAGENAAGLDDVRHLAAAGVGVLQPSATKIGGITGMLEASAIARQAGARLAPHSAYFGPGLAATIHVAAALPERPAVEWYDCRLDAFPAAGLVPSGGRLAVPDGPGLGIAIDDDIVARYRVDRGAGRG